ncbi:MAG: FecR family protein [Chlorobi bacterium]|nr:FecR family protein [Chlorobiota bacterium]
MFIRNIAAATLIPLIITTIYITEKKNSDRKKFDNKITAITSPGEKSKIILPDSSIVWLNSDSKLSYSNFGENGARRVSIEGEAFFEVTKNVSLPFIVTTKDYNVKVLGTKFNVRSYNNENESETVLEEGSVLIEMPDGQKFKLSPGQMALKVKEHKLSIKNVSVETKICWKDNILKFNNTPIKDMIPMLERWYGVHIIVPNLTNVSDKRITMTIKTESLHEVLQLIKYVTPIKYSINGDNVKIIFL